MKSILLFGLLILVIGGGVLYFGIIGKVMKKIYTPKKEKKEVE